MNKNELTEYVDFLLQAAMRKCYNLSDAQDLVQETLLTAMTAIDRGIVMNEPQNWLSTVLNRKYYDMLRQKYRKPTVCIDVIGDIEDKSESDDDSEDVENIRRCLANLTKIYREVMVQHYMNGKSIADISVQLGIPENTVKNRLFTGRKHIRKEFAMENYSKQSYEPDDLWISNSGRSGLDGEPFSTVGNDKIAMNLLILAYDKPVTIPELAKAIGISTTFIEPIVERLVKDELMKESADKVYTDFIIYTETDRTVNVPLQVELAKQLCGDIWKIVDKGLEELRERNYYKKQSREQAVKLESFFAVRTVLHAVNNVRDEVCGGMLPFEEYPDRPNGGKWFAMGNAYPHGYDYDSRSYTIYDISGECVTDTADVLGAKRISLCSYATDLSILGKTDHNFSYLSSMTKLYYSVYLRNYDLFEMFDRKVLDKIDELISIDFFRRDDDKKLLLNIPVIAMQDRWNIYKLSEKYDNMISTEFHDAFMKLMKNPVKLPKHLKSVPRWQQYMRCCDSFPMAVVLEAKNCGLFLNGYDKPAPAVMLCVEE